MAALSFPTPLHGHVGRGTFSDVYEPAEDTFLLLDVLEAAAAELAGVEICLEVGAGSGVVSAFLASMIGPQALYMCTDVNPEAAACTLETARCNGVHIQPVITDLVKGLLPRLKEKVDLLVFNPPYVVTPSEEVKHTTKCRKSRNRSSLGWWQTWSGSHGQVFSPGFRSPFTKRIILFSYH
ncbi:methyltransferase HEMK2 isoform X5 [Callithrix jacchus]